LALVKLRNTAGIIVRDITDVSKPVSRCAITGATPNFFRFVNATHISYIVTSNDAGALYLVNLSTRTTSLVRAWTNEGTLYWVYAWSPDGKALSYLRSNGDKVEWHLLTAAGDVKMSDLGSIPGRGVDPNSDDAMVGFSADGRYVALENTFSSSTGAAGQAPPFQVVRLSDRKLVYSRTAGTMAAWARKGATIYFRTASGVESWDPSGATHVVVPQGFRWIHPWPSSDGKLIAYVDADSKGNHYPGYVRLSDKQAIRVSTRPRTGAAFLNSTLMWYAEESICPAGCGFGGPSLTGRTYIYDVVAKTEGASVIAAVFDSWPHIT
jgi:Tol biopolymer transport system component